MSSPYPYPSPAAEPTRPTYSSAPDRTGEVQRHYWARWSASWAVLSSLIHFTLSAINSNTPVKVPVLTEWSTNSLWIMLVFAALAVALLGWTFIVRAGTAR